MVERPNKGFMAQTTNYAVAIDAGLRAYMLRVYSYMGIGLGLTGLVAYVIGNTPAFFAAVYGSPLKWVVMFAPIGFALFFGMRLQAIRASTAQMLFWVFAAVMGMSLAYIFQIYTGASITRTFFVTSGAFLGLSLYGYTTKRDLTGMGAFLVMGLFGLIIAMLINMFLASPGLDFALSIIGVLIFTGLTAYDAQKIKEMYFAADGEEVAAKKSILGALTLYLDFINLFLYMLRFMGDRR